MSKVKFFIDKTTTLPGGFYPVLIRGGKFSGKAFVINNISFGPASEVVVDYSLVKGVIMEQDVDELGQLIEDYIEDILTAVVEGKEIDN